MYKTKYALLHLSRTYTNVYIGMGSTCMYKAHFNRTSFIKARVLLAQSVEHQTTNLQVDGSKPTVGKNFSFCVFGF